MRSQALCPVVLVLGFVLGGGVFVPPVRAGDDAAVVEGALGARLDETVLRASNGGFWGAILVAKDGKVLLAKGYGFADYEKRPNQADTLFEIASVSKPFAAAAILRLQMDGKLALDDPITKFFRKVPEDKRGITVRHLLTHTSGIGGDVGLPYATRATRAKLVEHVLEPPLVTPPGEAFAYCNFGYALVAAIVEEASRTSYEKYLKKHLFKPAGMVDTGFIRDKDLDAKRDTVRRSDSMQGATALTWWWGWGYRGMGGIVSTVWDLYRWDRALRTDAVLDEAARAAYATHALEGYALGWKVETTDRGTTKVHHSGGVAGYACQYARYPEDDVVIVVLSNGGSDVLSIEQRLASQLFPPPVVEATIDVSPYTLSRYRAAELPAAARWIARKDGTGLRLALHDPGADHDAAVVRLPAGPARKLAADLEQMLAGRRAAGPPGMSSGVYLNAYPDAGERFELSKTVRLLLLPRYKGRGEDGGTIEEEVIFLVLIDDAKGFWPVMTKMDDGVARALLADLKAAIPS